MTCSVAFRAFCVYRSASGVSCRADAQKRCTGRHDAASSSSEWLRRTVLFAPVPALAMTLRWDIVAWNQLTTRVFRDYGAVPAAERNLLKIVLTDARYRCDPDAYEQMARNLLGEFRIDFGRCAGDPKFEQLIAELCEIGARVRASLEQSRAVELAARHVVQSEKFGELYFDRVTYVPEFTRRSAS